MVGFASSRGYQIVQRAQNTEATRHASGFVHLIGFVKRELLLLRGFQGLKFEEIARAMSCSVNTIKGRALRAVHELKVLVQDLAGEKVI